MDIDEFKAKKRKIQRQNWLNHLWKKWVTTPEKMLKEEAVVLKQEIAREGFRNFD